MTDFKYVGSELDLFSKAVNWKSYLRKEIQPFLGSRVLEVGSGIGGTTQVLCDGTQEQWVCLEPDADLAEKTQSGIRSGSIPRCCRVQVGDVNDMDTASEFDAILYIDVLEHIERDLEELHRAARLLAPEGRLIILSPAHQFLYSPFDEAVGHHRRYTAKTYMKAAPTSLRLTRIRYLDSVGLLASLSIRLFFRSSLPTHRQIRVWDRMMVPVSRLIDPVLFYRVGKTILGIWERNGSQEGGSLIRSDSTSVSWAAVSSS